MRKRLCRFFKTSLQYTNYKVKSATVPFPSCRFTATPHISPWFPAIHSSSSPPLHFRTPPSLIHPSLNVLRPHIAHACLCAHRAHQQTGTEHRRLFNAGTNTATTCEVGEPGFRNILQGKVTTWWIKENHKQRRPRFSFQTAHSWLLYFSIKLLPLCSLWWILHLNTLKLTFEKYSR